MNQQSILIAGVVALGLVIAAFAITGSNSGVGNAPENATGEYLLPDLRERLNEAAKLTITEKESELTLEKKGEQWVLADKSGYPAKFDEIRKLLITLSEMKIEEKKTANPDMFSRIDLTEPGPDSNAKRVGVYTANGDGIAELIIGKTNFSGGERSTFVRLAGENQTYLASGDATVRTRENNWMDTTVVDVQADRARRVEIVHPDGEVVTAEKAEEGDENFELLNIPSGFQPQSESIANSLGGTFRSVRFDDVTARDGAELEGQPAVVTLETFDGLTVTADVYSGDDETSQVVFNAFTAEDAEEEVNQEAVEINELASNWVYTVPSYIGNRMTRRMDFFTEEVEVEGPVVEESADANAQETETLTVDLAEEDDSADNEPETESVN